MKKQEEKKLHLDKVTIENLDSIMEKNEQRMIRGGSDTGPNYTTIVPVYCKP